MIRSLAFCLTFVALNLNPAVATMLDTLRVMPLGDSLTAGGYNLKGEWHIDGGYRIHLAAMLRESGVNFNFVGSQSNGEGLFSETRHEGHSGWKINELSEIVEAKLTEHSPDVILLMIGTNDIVKNYNLPQASSRFRALLEKITVNRLNSRIFIGSILKTNSRDFNKKIKKYNTEIENLTKAFSPNVRWVDFSISTDDNEVLFSSADFTDGVHLTENGYKKMARIWLAAISPFIL